jgi:uncharacterized membrane protein YgcG
MLRNLLLCGRLYIPKMYRTILPRLSCRDTKTTTSRSPFLTLTDQGDQASPHKTRHTPQASITRIHGLSPSQPTNSQPASAFTQLPLPSPSSRPTTSQQRQPTATMCYVKRIHWACGCIKGVVITQHCDKTGTPDCRFRHLLERLRVGIPCQGCRSPASPLPPLRPRRLHHRRRRNNPPGVRPVAFIIRRRSGSGSSAGSGLWSSPSSRASGGSGGRVSGGTAGSSSP